jgi:zinc transport system ATP-binding protein
MAPSIQCKNITVTADGLKILDSISTFIPESSVTAVIGPNGAGKTTLLKVLLGKINFSGQLNFVDSEGREIVPNFGYVPQNMNFDRGLPVTVIDFLVMPFRSRPLWMGKKKEIVELARENLNLVEAGHLVDRSLGKLSGGELQRVLLASALTGKPDLLLLDEPVSGIDISGEKMFCDLLDSIQKKKRFTMVIVSHDLSIVSNHAEYVLCLNKKMICQGKTAEILTPDNLQNVFGHHTEIVRRHHLITSNHLKDINNDGTV